ncbi:hypothetical protein QUF56_09220 [Ureibacillus composti]|nr:hypothetical protein [Ureibacillus composti]
MDLAKKSAKGIENLEKQKTLQEIARTFAKQGIDMKVVKRCELERTY